MRVPEIPNLEHDETLSGILGVEGRVAMIDLCQDAEKALRHVLGNHGHIPDWFIVGPTLLPFLYEARRIGEERGIARERNPVSALFPTEDASSDG